MANAKVIDYQLFSVDPALPVGRMNIAVHADAPGNPIRNYYLNARNHGGVDARTTVTETIGLAAQGKIVTLNAAAATAVTLDSTVPATFMAYVTAEGAGGATLTPSTGLIDNAANLALFQLQGVVVFFDGTNWWTERGMFGGGSTGVLLETGNYTTSTADNGKLISFDLAANATLTLPAVAPPGTWSIEVENTQPEGLLFVNPNGLMLDESTAEVPIPAPHGMRIFSNGTNYYTERGMPDVNAQPCSITVDGSDRFSFAAFALIASFQTTTPASNLGFRQAVGASVAQVHGGLSVNMVCLQGSTIVVIAEVVSAFFPFAGVQDSQGNLYNPIFVSLGGSYGYLMFYAVNVAAGPNTVEVILSEFPVVSPMGDVGSATVGSSAGTGFTVGDFLQVNGGGGSGAILKVASLSGSAIASFTVVSGGNGYANTTNAALVVLTGSGSGAPTANITINGFPYTALNGIPVPSITGIVFPKGGLASSTTLPPNREYYVSTVNGNNQLLGVPPYWIPWPGLAMVAMEYQGAGSGVTLLGSNSGTAPGLPVPSGSVPCPPPGSGWSVGAGLNPNRGDPASFPEVWSASPGWQKRITVAQPAIFPFFGGAGSFSMAAFDGFGCCSPGFYQGVGSGGGGGIVTQQPKLRFLAPIIVTDDPANSSTDVQVPDMVGDAGSGGVDGLVPAPPSGSAAAGDFLKADGTWAVPPGTSPLPDPVTVPHGGTGDTTLTVHGVLIGEGTSAVAATAAGAAGLFLGGNGAADPTFQNALGSVDARTTTTETVAVASRGKLVTFSNVSAVSVTLDSTVPNYFACGAQNIGTGTATLTPSSGTINGAANLALTTGQSCLLFFNGTNWWAMLGAGSGGGLNGVNVQTGDYSLLSGDNGKNVILNSGSAHTFTLPNPPPSTTWAVFVQDIGAGTLTVSRNSLNIDGAASNLTLLTGQGVVIFTDGTNYFTERGLSSVGSVGGDISANSSTSQEVIGILNKLIDGTTPTDGQILQYSSATGKWEMVVDRPIFPVSAVVGMPNTGQLVCIYTAASSMIFPANFATPNSYGTLSTNPTSTAVYKVLKNGTQVGTVTISTAGAFTFATTGGTTFTLNAGDRLTITAPNPQDATLADVGITLVGTRSATVPSALGQGIFIWRGTYNNATAYNINDVVAYTFGGQVQSYICILGTTGNAPTNTTYWNLMAQAGAAGGGSVSGIQQETYTYAADTGVANAYIADIGPTPTRVAGSIVVMKAAHTNTGASTLDDGSGSGATAIKKNATTALAANDIIANEIYMFVFDGTNWQLLSWPGTPGGDVTAKYITGDSSVPTDLANAKIWPGLYNSPDIPPASPTAFDDEFDGVFNAGSLWTWQNQGSATAADSNSWLGMVFPSNGNVDSIRYITQNLPGGTSAFTVKMSFQTAQATNFFYPAFLFRESSTSKLVTLLYGYIGGATLGLNIYNWTSNTAVGSNLFSSGTRTLPMIVYLTLKYDGTNIYFSWSADGVNFQQVYQESKTAHFTTAPNQIGIGCDPENEKGIVGFDFFRRTL